MPDDRPVDGTVLSGLAAYLGLRFGRLECRVVDPRGTVREAVDVRTGRTFRVVPGAFRTSRGP